ncbi:MAG: hypothetical protein FJ190_01820 [Gammaproteobacteria bacterium]|nr:hypothetical protein [Gammaproteobacteria bacterium]
MKLPQIICLTTSILSWRIRTTNHNFSEWLQVFDGVKMVTALHDRVIHHCDNLETVNDSYRFKHRIKTMKNL